MERLTVKRKDGRWALANSANMSNIGMMDKIPLAINRLAAYEEAEEAGLLVRLQKNFKIVVARKKTESNAIINELIHAMCPYADDDRLFKAVDALRVFVAQQNNFIDTLSNSKAALKEG